jgi:hypothetical protein
MLSCAAYGLQVHVLVLLLAALELVNGAFGDVDVVLSYYNEPVDTLVAFIDQARLAVSHAGSLHVFMYCQGVLSLDDAQRIPDDWVVTFLPNVNREAHAYAAYLREHRARDASFVWFTQAAPNGLKPHTRYLWSRLRHLTPRTGMLGLCGVGSSTCAAWSEDSSRIAQLYAMTQRRFCVDNTSWTVFFNGEFLVSRKRILASPKWMYDMIWAASTEATKGTTSYAFAFTMERSWNLLFNCTAPERTPRKYAEDIFHKNRNFQCLDV